MTLSTIVPIVEGHGDVQAVPLLLRRLVDAAQAWGTVDIDTPIRCKRSQLVSQSELTRAVGVALLRRHCGGVLILFDSDDDCPVERAGQVRQWAAARAGGVPCEVVLAKREYEAWLLSAAESLRRHPSVKDDASSPSDPEAPRSAKDALEAMMHIGYSPTAHQPAFSSMFCMAAAYARSRSFRKLVGAVGHLTGRMGADLRGWPPTAWQEGRV